MLSASDVYHWLLLVLTELLKLFESLSFDIGVITFSWTVLLRLFFSFLSFLVRAPRVPNLLDPGPNTGPVKMARLEDNDVVAMREDLLTPFCPLKI